MVLLGGRKVKSNLINLIKIIECINDYDQNSECTINYINGQYYIEYNTHAKNKLKSDKNFFDNVKNLIRTEVTEKKLENVSISECKRETTERTLAEISKRTKNPVFEIIKFSKDVLGHEYAATYDILYDLDKAIEITKKLNMTNIGYDTYYEIKRY